MSMDSFKWQLLSIIVQSSQQLWVMISSAEGRAISMTTILTLLNSMKSSVYPPFTIFPLNLLFSVTVFALLLPNSVCVDSQYDACQGNQTCGSTELQFPFRKTGCGLTEFQINCVDDLLPVLQINSVGYTIVNVLPANNSFTMVTEKSFQDCASSPDVQAPNLNGTFNIAATSNTNMTVYKCPAACTPYRTFPNPLCPVVEQMNLSLKVLTVQWDTSPDLEMCEACEKSSGYCGYNSSSDLVCLCKDGIQSYQCPKARRNVKVGVGVIAAVAAGIAILLIVVILLLIAVRKRASPSSKVEKFLLLIAFRKRASSSSKVEKFLQDFTHEMPIRYSYSQLKKITNNLAEKLGEGGFGVVYKGKLSNENLVAVKILDQSRQSESQFMNEVATVGRIHHVHLVRLMGYCFERFRSAVVYEYMTNGSLEKFLFTKKEKPQILNWEQLYSIALGAARGIAYLHEECERRIIHFDIKPHNILLDADFTPKVSDFGLAKLRGRLDDHISITAARGTPGYVAPELWTRNLGPITDKADVYSFGMLLLEIAGRRKNIEVQVSRSSEIYFPDWAFKLLEKGELEERLRGRIGGEIAIENDAQVLRMCKVGLWCIQYKSVDRPTMSRVVEMLEGKGDEVSNPPFPFNSASSPQQPLISSSEESSFL